MIKINDLRSYITVLEKAGQLTRVTKSVDILHELADVGLIECVGVDRRRVSLYLVRVPAPANFRVPKAVQSFEGIAARYRKVAPDRATPGKSSVPLGSHSVAPDRDTSGSGSGHYDNIRDSETKRHPPIVPPQSSIAVKPGTWPKHPQAWERWKAIRTTLVSADPAFAVLPEAVAWLGKGTLGVKEDQIAEMSQEHKAELTRLLIDEGIREIRVCGGFD